MKLSISLLAVLLAGALESGDRVRVDGLHGLGDTRHHVMRSELQGRAYDILVGLPQDYDSRADRRYPTVYILDGGVLYPMLRSYYNYLRLADEIPEMILVAVSYGSGDYEDGNDRGHDYTAPSPERDYYGGAGDFQTFLQAELMPAIEREYRSEPRRRIIFGQSLGGQFVIYTAQTRPSLFWGHIASNPALHRNLPFFLETRPRAVKGAPPSRLFVASAEHDAPAFRQPALAWIEHWTAEPDKPWQLEVRTLPGHGHFSAPPASFRDGLRWLFAEQR